MNRRGPFWVRLLRTARFTLLGSVACVAFVHWSAGHWWVGPLVLALVAAAVSVLWRW